MGLFYFCITFVPVLYKISTLVDNAVWSSTSTVPVLYKISTLVDLQVNRNQPTVPVLYKISTLVDLLLLILKILCSRSLQNFYSCR